MDCKDIAVNLVFAIVGLCLTMGLVGISVYMSHWYSLINTDAFADVMGPTWKKVGISAATFLTLSVITAVLSFSFDCTTHLLIVSCVCQLPAFILVCIITSYASDHDGLLKAYKDNYHKEEIMNKFQKAWLCKGIAGIDECNDTYNSVNKIDNCCDPVIASLIENRTTRSYPWLLGFTLLWVLSLVILVVLSFFFCRNPEKDD